MADNNNQLMSRLRLFFAFLVTLAITGAMTSYTWLSAMYWPDIQFPINDLVSVGFVLGAMFFLYSYLIKGSIKWRSLEETNDQNQIMPRQLLIAFLIGVVFFAPMFAFSWATATYWPDLPFLVRLVVDVLLIIGFSVTANKVLNRPKVK